MSNPRRGEITASIGGRPRTLCLTLGALAELEAALGADDLQALGRRFGEGRLATRDLLAVLAAGFAGGDRSLDFDGLAALPLEGELPRLVDAAARLLQAAFGTAEEDAPDLPPPLPPSRPGVAPERRGP